MWLVAGFLYYGFNFSWSELGEDLYISYFFAAIGECLAYLGMGFPTKYFGRKASMMAFYLIGEYGVGTGSFGSILLIKIIYIRLTIGYSTI